MALNNYRDNLRVGRIVLHFEVYYEEKKMIVINKGIWRRKPRSDKFEDVTSFRVLPPIVAYTSEGANIGYCNFRYGWILTNGDAILVVGGYPYYGWRDYSGWKIGEVNVFDDVKSLAVYFARNNIFISPSRAWIPRSIFGYSFRYKRWFCGTYLYKKFGRYEGRGRCSTIKNLVSKYAIIRWRDIHCCRWVDRRGIGRDCGITYRIVYLRMPRNVWCKILSLAGLKK